MTTSPHRFRYHERYIDALGLGPAETDALLAFAEDQLEIVDRDVGQVLDQIAGINVAAALILPGVGPDGSRATNGFGPVGRALTRDIDRWVDTMGPTFGPCDRIRYRVGVGRDHVDETRGAGVGFLIQAGRHRAARPRFDHEIIELIERFGIDWFIVRDSRDQRWRRRWRDQHGWCGGDVLPEPIANQDGAVVFTLIKQVVSLERRYLRDGVGPMGMSFIMDRYRNARSGASE